MDVVQLRMLIFIRQIVSPQKNKKKIVKIKLKIVKLPYCGVGWGGVTERLA